MPQFMKKISIYKASLIGSSVIFIKNILSGGSVIVLVNFIIIYGLSGVEHILLVSYLAG